jgi:hypothetical protein
MAKVREARQTYRRFRLEAGLRRVYRHSLFFLATHASGFPVRAWAFIGWQQEWFRKRTYIQPAGA